MAQSIFWFIFIFSAAVYFPGAFVWEEIYLMPDEKATPAELSAALFYFHGVVSECDGKSSTVQWSGSDDGPLIYILDHKRDRPSVEGGECSGVISALRTF